MCVDPVLRREKKFYVGTLDSSYTSQCPFRIHFHFVQWTFPQDQATLASLKWVSSKEIVKHCLKAIDDLHSYTHVYNHVPLCTSSFPFVLSDRSDDIITSK